MGVHRQNILGYIKELGQMDNSEITTEILGDVIVIWIHNKYVIFLYREIPKVQTVLQCQNSLCF